MSEYFVEEMSRLLDEEKQMTHKALSARVDAKIDDAKFFNKLGKLPAEFDAQQIDWAYGPVIQAGESMTLDSQQCLITAILNRALLSLGSGYGIRLTVQ